MSQQDLLDAAAELHDAALDPERCEKVVHTVRKRIAQGRAAGRLTEADVAWIETMIENATHVCREIASLTLSRAFTRAGIDTLPIGLALADADGRVLHANREAARILSTSSDVEALVTSTAVQCADSSRIALLPRQGARPVELLAVPCRPIVEPLLSQVPRVVLFLIDPARSADAYERGLRAAFQLTAAEARLAARLAHGDSLQECARVLGITKATARTHLSRLFAKTDTSRQAELVRLLVMTSITSGGGD